MAEGQQIPQAHEAFLRKNLEYIDTLTIVDIADILRKKIAKNTGVGMLPLVVTAVGLIWITWATQNQHTEMITQINSTLNQHTDMITQINSTQNQQFGRVQTRIDGVNKKLDEIQVTLSEILIVNKNYESRLVILETVSPSPQ